MQMSRNRLTNREETPIAIPSNRLADLNHSFHEDAEWVRDPVDPASILALPEVFVQLGYVNFLRQLIYRNKRDYGHLPSFQGSILNVWERAHQCLERLRQTVMCGADTVANRLRFGCEL
jgi:Mycotoxin biosynthesis protein UstYa